MEHKDFGKRKRQYSGDINRIHSHYTLINSAYQKLNSVVLPHGLSYVKSGLVVIYAQVQKCTLQKMDKTNGFHQLDKTVLVHRAIGNVKLESH